MPAPAPFNRLALSSQAHLRSYEALGIEAHFDPDFRFRHYEADPVTGKAFLTARRCVGWGYCNAVDI